ncbi:helix-turn-helix domain-containing protein [Nocardiopsis sp. ARC36]
MSPFHLSRLFTQEVGVSPGRYIGAIRMFEAKRRLVYSSMNICDIVHSVGYNSVGTFTSRFTRQVGMSPREYRKPEVGRLMVAISKDFNRMPSPNELVGFQTRHRPAGARHTGQVRGMIELPRAIPGGCVLVGLYDTIVPQNRPVAYRFLPASEHVPFVLHDVPRGSGASWPWPCARARPPVPTSWSARSPAASWCARTWTPGHGCPCAGSRPPMCPWPSASPERPPGPPRTNTPPARPTSRPRSWAATDDGAGGAAPPRPDPGREADPRRDARLPPGAGAVP